MVDARRVLVVVGLACSLSAASVAMAQGAAPGGAQPAAAAPPAQRKPVQTADDLPRHTYKVEGKASEFVLSGAPFKAFMQRVRADLESDLAAFDIKDPTTLQQYYATLQAAAMIDGRIDDAVGYVEKIRAVETKEAQRIFSGTVLLSLQAAKKAGGDASATDAAFRKDLEARLRAMPWDKVREIIVQRKGQMEIIRRELILGQLQSGLDPVVESTNGEVSGEIARGLVQARAQFDVFLPLRESMLAVYSKVIADNAVAAKDIWAERSVTLSEKEALTPVTLAVWDSGVDTAVFPKNLWVNKNEKIDGVDNDQNGFVDDVNGIAFDLDSKPVTTLLLPLTDLKGERDQVMKFSKGLSDVQANVESAEATALKAHMGKLSPEQVGPFIENLGLWGNHMHGTHVAGIASEGNPAAKILAARIEFDYRQIPLRAPTMEDSLAQAAAAKQTVNYFKAAGVRVVNMSWGGSRQDIENALEQKGVGKTPQERAELARKFFAVYREGLEEAIKSAPDILFVAAAGNSNNDSQFSEMIPSGLDCGNMITIGAVDQSGKPTGFTTFGKNVKLYANGFEVESFVPGGTRMKASGTSMAAPQVANLAAKLLAIDPRLSSQQVVELIVQGADPMPGQKPGEGRLLINPKKSVELLRSRKG